MTPRDLIMLGAGAALCLSVSFILAIGFIVVMHINGSYTTPDQESLASVKTEVRR